MLAREVESVTRIKSATSVPAVPPSTVIKLRFPNCVPLAVPLVKVSSVKTPATAVAPLVVMVLSIFNLASGVVSPIPTLPFRNTAAYSVPAPVPAST